MKKKILYICSEFAPGMIPFASTIINVMAENESFEVFAIVVSKDNLSYKNTLNPKAKEKTIFLEYPAKKHQRLLYKFYPAQLLRNIQQLCKSENIETIHCLTGEYCLFAFFAKLKKKYTIYYTLHDLVAHEAKISGLKDRFFELYFTRAVKYNLRQLNFIATSSLAQKEKLKIYYPEKSIYYHHFPSLLTQQIVKGDDTCPELVGIKNYVLFFGSIQVYKGIDYLYKIFIEDEELKSQTLVIAGSGNYYFSTDSAKEQNIIKINRFINDNEINQLFKNAACVVYPYISATQSGVILLAYYFGIPVVASDIDYFKECIVDNKTGLLFKNKDIEDMSSKIKTIIRNKNPNQYTLEQKQFLENNFSSNALRKELEDIYQPQ